LAFAPHTDTVGVSGMTVDPFRPVEKNGRIYGRGASDTKGPMASLLWALQRWSRAGRTLREGLQVTFAALMGEEAGNEGAIALAESGFRADLVVVCEPTNLKVVYAHKGAFWFELLALGKACHGSTPEKGINAIEVMAEVFPGVKKQLLRELSRRPSPLGPATLNFGVIQGGSAINIVPDRCRLLCDLRFPPSWRPEEILRILRRGKKAWGRRVRWKLLRKAPGLACDPKHPWIAKLAEAGRGLATAPWFCDAAIFAQKGLSAVAFGPGSIAQAHTADEFISKKELTEGALAYWSFLQKVARAE
jgi:acetylornithine deacetylase/succinyl-diaminopimelate desuccinylase-like protein